MSETIRERKDIPQKDTWALEDLYATDADWEKALARMQARMPELSEFEGKLAQNGQTLCAFWPCWRSWIPRRRVWATTPCAGGTRIPGTQTIRP